MHIVGAARQEESISTFLGALLCQSLEIPELADRHPPHGQHEGVETIIPGREALGRWPGLKHGVVPNAGGKVVVVEEVNHLLRLLKARIRMLWQRLLVCECLLPRSVQAEVLVHPTESHNENVPGLEGDLLRFGTGLEV